MGNVSARLGYGSIEGTQKMDEANDFTLEMALVSEDAYRPIYEDKDSAVLTLYLAHDLNLQRGVPTSADTGVELRFPKYVGGQLQGHPMLLQEGRCVIAHAQFIDQCSRGTIRIVLTNISEGNEVLLAGSPIATIVVVPTARATLVDADADADADAGAGATTSAVEELAQRADTSPPVAIVVRSDSAV
jgi:dUTPase